MSVQTRPGTLQQNDDQRDHQVSLQSEDYIVRAMPAVLGRRDMTITYIMALFLLTNAVSGAAGGPVSLIYLGLGAIFFFLPCVVAATQLGVMFPHEGSLYNWTTKAINPFWGFFIGICYWLTGVLAVITAGSAFVTTMQGLNNSLFSQPWQQGVVIIALVAFVGIIGWQQMRVTQNIVNIIFLFTLLGVLLVGIAAIIWLVTGHASATNFADPTGWAINSGNYFLFAIITLNFIGASGPLNMAGEIRGRNTPQLPHIIKSQFLWGTPVVIVLYTVVTLSVLVVRGSAILQATVLPFEAFTAVNITIGRAVGDIAAICFLLYCVAAMLFYTYASARLLLVAAIDERISSVFGRLNKNRVPSTATIFQVCATIFVVALIYILAPYLVNFGGNATNTAQEIYNVVAAATTLIWTFATLFFFFNIVFFYRQNPSAFRSQRVFPMPVIWLSVLVGFVACLVTIGGILVYPWIPLIGNNQWWYLVGGLAVAVLLIACIGSMFANSQALYEGLENNSR